VLIKPYDELREPDPRTLGFLPNGLGVGLAMYPEDSARHWQEVVARYELNPGVTEGTRHSFNDLRTAFAYGLFCYEIFTLVDSQALLVFEQALRDRFVDYHAGTVTFVQGTVAHKVPAASFADVLAFMDAHRKPRLRLAMSAGPDTKTIEFNGMLAGLQRWARAAGLLAGQRNRSIESALSALRNDIAHPTEYHLVMPVDAARTLRDLAEIINNLWGFATPGGRLYPAPIERYPVAIAWNPTTGAICTTVAANLTASHRWDRYTHYAIVQSVWIDDAPHIDPKLEQYDSVYETTPYPTEYLWGPGSRHDAMAWLDGADAAPDTCTTLDREFAIRVDDGVVWRPMRPANAGGLAAELTGGTWYLVRADAPDHALNHVRQLVAGRPCMATGPCPNCPVEGLAYGPHHEVLTAHGIPVSPDDVSKPDFAVSIPLPIDRSFPITS
jgi:hypothetical protein